MFLQREFPAAFITRLLPLTRRAAGQPARQIACKKIIYFLIGYRATQRNNNFYVPSGTAPRNEPPTSLLVQGCRSQLETRVLFIVPQWASINFALLLLICGPKMIVFYMRFYCLPSLPTAGLFKGLPLAEFD